ncbi:hypothetical protein GGF40_002031 [Coemansia sp. RSA 1286]|nr:hypothetical protein IWW45_001779 [Coemansia sp. RSA 485]KAJ2637906.1 hypothetical protein GGF40_002031 [Coemansia sp. RSA 1286]
MTSDPVRLSMQMTDFGRLITSSMPRIVDVQLLATRITLNSIENNALTVGLSNALGDMLWQKYAAQTTALKCNFYPTNLSFAQFDSLGYIEVSLQNKHQYCFANISANMLKRVCLTEVPQHFSLARFCGSCGIAGNNLVFGNLLSLNMSFSEETVDPLVPVNNNNNNSHSLENAEENNYNDKTCAISFPKLQKLMLTNLPATTASDAMFGSHYPEHLEVLKISSKMNSLGNLDKMQNTVSSICSLDLSIKEVNEYDQDQFSSLTNSLLGSQMQCQNASLTVTGLKFQLDDTKLSWTNITKLHIINLLDYHTLSGILTKCKKLRSLVTGLDIAQPLVDTHTDLLREPLLPLNTAIEALRIVALAQNANKKDVCEGLERLVVRLPGLLKLNLPANVQINMPEVVAKYKEVYPHLSNIAVFQGRPVALNRSNSRLRMLFANSRAPALTIQSRS